MQASDTWVAVLGARIVLSDDTEVRAVMSGHWLTQMGWDVYVLKGGIASGPVETGMPAQPVADGVAAIDAASLQNQHDSYTVIDVSTDMTFRQEHLPDAIWWHRSRLAELTLPDGPVCVVSEDGALASFAAADLARLGFKNVCFLSGGLAAWKAAGHETVASPDTPSDQDSLDFHFWVHDRHYNNAEAATYYLDWEVNLPAQIERDGDARYNLLN